jgi:hypothetical protein
MAGSSVSDCGIFTGGCLFVNLNQLTARHRPNCATLAALNLLHCSHRQSSRSPGVGKRPAAAGLDGLSKLTSNLSNTRQATQANSFSAGHLYSLLCPLSDRQGGPNLNAGSVRNRSECMLGVNFFKSIGLMGSQVAQRKSCPIWGSQ